MTHRKAWHSGRYPELAALVRRRANADPTTRCGQLPDGTIHPKGCGQHARPGDPWQAGHVVDGKIVHTITDLMPQHRSCNTSDGAARGNRMRVQTYDREW